MLVRGGFHCSIERESSLARFAVALSWQKAQESKLRRAVEKGFATALVMSRAADHDWRAYLITGIATLIFVGAAALLGYVGFV